MASYAPVIPQIEALLPKWQVLISLLENGRFGPVWKFQDTSYKWPYFKAMKIIPVETKDNCWGENEEDESYTRYSFPSHIYSHRNIVSELDSKKMKISASDFNLLQGTSSTNTTETVSVLCLQMELCGETLPSFLRQEKELENLLILQLGIVKGVRDGLAYLHDKNIIHGDFQPSKIYFSSDCFKLPVKIGGYFLRSILSEEQISRCESSKNNYKAPELFEGIVKPTFQSDIFSLGLIIWEVIQLLPQEDLAACFLSLIQGNKNLIKPSKIVANIQENIPQMCEKDEKKRIQTMKDVHLIEGELEKAFVANNSEELQQLLEACEDSWTITLKDGTYKGHFEIKKDNVSLIGQGLTTILKAHFSTTVLNIEGANCHISGIQILADEGEHKRGGIETTKGTAIIENVKISDCKIGLHIKQSAENTKISDVEITNTMHGISFKGKLFHLNKTTMENCRSGIDIDLRGDDANGVIETMKISGIQNYGILIRWVENLKLTDVFF